MSEFNVKRSHNVLVRNLRFDELWEWDELNKGDYDSKDWDFITIGDSGNCTNVWIDHCDFTKSYDGTVDIKGGA
jgi:pectate lyase